MGKTRNDYLVSEHMDKEELTIYDCNMSLESEIDEDCNDEMSDMLKYSYECSIQTFENDVLCA
jgi:hypothetical protein